MKRILQILWKFITSLFISKKIEAVNSPNLPTPLLKSLLWLKLKVYQAALSGAVIQSYLDQWDNTVKGYAFKTLGKVKQEVRKLKAEILWIEESLKLSFDDRRKVIAAKLWKHYQHTIKSIEEKYGVIKKTIIRLKNELNEARTTMFFFIENNRFIPIKKTWWDKPKALFYTIIANSIIEIPLSYQALEAHDIGVSLVLLFLSGTYSVVLGVIVDFVGRSLSKNNKAGSIFLIILGLLLVGIIIYVRATAPEGSTLEVVFHLLNIIFFIISLVIAKRTHRDRPYWEAKEKEIELIQQIEGLEALQQMKSIELQSANDQYFTDTYTETVNVIALERDRLEEISLILAEKEPELEHKQGLIEAYREDGIAFLTAVYAGGQNTYN